METLEHIINTVSDVMWTYIVIAMLLGCAVYFTWRIRFMQFTNLRTMLSQLTEGTPNGDGKKGHVSSFQAFAVALASVVGTGNIAGVAAAITVGGPGAVFWMWVIALFGSANAFIESTLAQLYKRRDKDGFIGGPAYYMLHGLNMRWMGIAFAAVLSATFGFAFVSVQSNTICLAWEHAFHIDHMWMGTFLTAFTIVTIFGGIHRIAKVSSIVVPVMAFGYFLLALGIVIYNITDLPSVLSQIFCGAFGIEQAVGGGIGVAVMQGIKRGLFSNEAGMGAVPNVAATASTSHPVTQGLIQALCVFADTLVICSCTAFIILVSEPSTDASLSGIQLAQAAISSHVGSFGAPFIAFSILMFAGSSIIGCYYYGEVNMRFITRNSALVRIYRLLVSAMVMCGALMTLDLAWGLADVMMGVMSICNLIAILFLSRQAIWLYNDFITKKRRGTRAPTFHRDEMPEELRHNIECWDAEQRTLS